MKICKKCKGEFDEVDYENHLEHLNRTKLCN